jgi:hypothetical protein
VGKSAGRVTSARNQGPPLHQLACRLSRGVFPTTSIQDHYALSTQICIVKNKRSVCPVRVCYGMTSCLASDDANRVRTMNRQLEMEQELHYSPNIHRPSSISEGARGLEIWFWLPPLGRSTHLGLRCGC